MFLPQGIFSTEFPLLKKRHKCSDVRLDLWLKDKDYCVISINYICPQKWGGGGGGGVFVHVLNCMDWLSPLVQSLWNCF